MSETLAKASRGCRFCRRRPHGVDYTTTHLEAPTLRDSPLVSSSREEKTRHEDANPVLISHWSPRSESDRIFSRYYLPRRFCARLRPVFLIFKNECHSKHLSVKIVNTFKASIRTPSRLGIIKFFKEFRRNSL